MACWGCGADSDSAAVASGHMAGCTSTAEEKGLPTNTSRGATLHSRCCISSALPSRRAPASMRHCTCAALAEAGGGASTTLAPVALHSASLHNRPCRMHDPFDNPQDDIPGLYSSLSWLTARTAVRGAAPALAVPAGPVGA